MVIRLVHHVARFVGGLSFGGRVHVRASGGRQVAERFLHCVLIGRWVVPDVAANLI